MQTIIPANTNVLSYLREKDIYVPAHCSGAGVCGKCVIRLVAGSLDITPADREHLSSAQLSEGFRLACKAFAKNPVRVEIIDKDSHIKTPDSLWQTPDKSHTFGLAADIGTTTIAVSLVDIDERRAVRTVSCANSGAAYGADVITRIGSSLSGSRAALKESLTKDISGAIASLEAGGLKIKKMTVAANTAMYHMLLGLDCQGLARAPFSPVTLGGETLSLSELLGGAFTISGADDIPVTLIRGISAFVGGDIASGLAYTLDDKEAEGTLFLDLGTNGEAALFIDSRLICASAAAGPALEGGELSCGVGGVKGAICRVYESGGRLGFDVIGNAPPIGICGSGAIDALACCLNRGLVDNQGVFLDSMIENGLCLVGDIFLTQHDIRELQLAKAAIRTCLETLLFRAGASCESIRKAVIAGGFGHYLDLDSAVGVGLIPKSLREKACSPGNTSLKGAERSLYDEGFFGRLARLTQSAVTAELSEDEYFKQQFIDNINFTV